MHGELCRRLVGFGPVQLSPGGWPVLRMGMSRDPGLWGGCRGSGVSSWSFRGLKNTRKKPPENHTLVELLIFERALSHRDDESVLTPATQTPHPFQSGEKRPGHGIWQVES